MTDISYEEFFPNDTNKYYLYSSRSLSNPETTIKRIFVPPDYRESFIEWYHSNILHPGANRTYDTIRKIFSWSGMQADITNFCRKCEHCRTCKRQGFKRYGKLPGKSHFSTTPWEKLSIDTAGPWKIKYKEKKNKIYEKTILVLTLMDEATRWCEVIRLPNHTAESSNKATDLHWLCRYPRPTTVIYDNGNEFLGEHFKELLISYGIDDCFATSVKILKEMG